MNSAEWKDLVHKSDTLQDPYEWRYYEIEDEFDVYERWTGEDIVPDEIFLHPDLMFNFWHEGIWK